MKIPRRSKPPASTIVPADPKAAPQSPQLEDEDDDDRLNISAEHFRYILALNEGPACYARFFDALLVKKSSHPDLFADLKNFRQQPSTIVLLEPATSDAFRQVSRAFIASRFAHPWCRTTSDFESGWTRASWVGGTRRTSHDVKREEERLYRLLVPIWIAFRRRMFPDQDVLRDWLAQQDLKASQSETRPHPSPATDIVTLHGSPARSPPLDRSTASQPAAISSERAQLPELGFKLASDPPQKSRSSADDLDSPGAPATAAHLLLGAAVTGYIMSDKRVKKYLEKKLKK